MRDIREIGIVIEQINQSVGSTMAKITGAARQPISARGSYTAYTYNLDFKERIKEIKVALGASGVTPEGEEVKEEVTLGDSFIKAADSYIDLLRVAREGIRNMTVPIIDNPTMQQAAQVLFANDSTVPKLPDGTIPYLGAEQVEKILDAGSKNTSMIKDGPDGGILNGSMELSLSCPSGDSACTGKLTGSLADILGKFIYQNTVCIMNSLFPTVMYAMMKPLMQFALWLRDSKRTTAEQMLAIGAIYAMPIVGATIGIFMLALLNDTFYFWLARIFCQAGVKAGMGTATEYKTICTVGAFKKKIAIIEYLAGTQTVYRAIDQDYFEDDIPVLGDAVSFIIYPDNSGTPSTTYTGTVVRFVWYNFFQKEPVYREGSIVYQSNDNVVAQDMPSYDVMLDASTQPIFRSLTGEVDSAQCASATQTLWVFLQYTFVDMLFNPEKYGMRDPVAAVGFMVAKDNFNSIAALGELARTQDDTDDKILAKLLLVYEEAKQTYTDVNGAIEGYKQTMLSGVANAGKYMDKAANNTKRLANLTSPVLSIIADGLYETYESMKYLLSPSEMHKVICCLFGEMINLAIEKWDYTKDINIENLIEKLRDIIDSIIKALELMIHIVGSDYIQIIQLLLQRGVDFVLQTASRILAELYNTLINVLDAWIDTLSYEKQGNWKDCLPWTITIDWIKKLGELLLRKFIEMLNLILSKLNANIQFNHDMIQRLSSLTLLYTLLNIFRDLRLSLGWLAECISMRDDNIVDVPTNDNTINLDDGSAVEYQKGEDPTMNFDPNVDPTANAHGYILMLRASQTAGKSILINKQKLAAVIERITRGDAGAITDYVNGKKEYETFEERACTDEKTRTLKDIFEYYHGKI